ncbi:endonuclease V [Archaeoglobus veneficus]|uniref:Endonuclease V n=1 Tax=Archaeoglobus veneficus (strain DSM 11195 / SNP6) TaxID=693661 RepID=F2KQ58_ARCVS|nr:endonuclease V [Archaeoglobus veneficus]AEA47661.1 Endonuclease V [Archaeoglobus veneficus SNP6]
MQLEELKKKQEKMAKRVVLRDLYSIDEIKYVLGVDQAFSGETVVSACVLLTFPELEHVDSNVSIAEAPMPYIPTFLMFREGEPAVEAVKKLLRRKAIIMVDGSGIAHPRKCGLATYVGLKLATPSIGITKKRLYGRVNEPQEVMESSPIYDEADGSVIGYAIKTCKRCRPIYVSPGHGFTPETALEIVKMCLRRHKLPEPVRFAHELASKAKKSL